MIQKPDADVDSGDARDLRYTLIVGGFTTLVFGAMVLASESGTGLLQIPTRETALMALSAALISVGGILALRFRLPLRAISWTVLVAYVLVVSLTVHFTGGPLTPMPALYLLVVVGASFLLGRRGTMWIAILSTICYAFILALEYSGALSMVLIWRQEFNPRERGVLLIVNWTAMAIPTMFTAILAGILAERLKTTNAHLRESERLRESLTKMLVHDLRNPLTALIGHIEIMRLTVAPKMDEEQRGLLEGARRSSRVLLGLVDEILDVGQIEAGELLPEREAVDLRGLITESVEAISALSEIEALTICTAIGDDLGVVECDRQMIGRVLANLLTNAVKYTPSGGTITVTAHRGASEVTVSVADTGSGIPAAYRERIFEKAGVVDRPGQGRRGTGLGLVFCRMAVEAHGGRIWVESEEGQGSTFFFTLPG